MITQECMEKSRYSYHNENSSLKSISMASSYIRMWKLGHKQGRRAVHTSLWNESTPAEDDSVAWTAKKPNYRELEKAGGHRNSLDKFEKEEIYDTFGSVDYCWNRWALRWHLKEYTVVSGVLRYWFTMWSTFGSRKARERERERERERVRVLELVGT